MPSYRDFQPSLRFQSTLCLSPHGRDVAYVDDATGQFNVTVRPISGGPARRLTSYSDSAVRRVAWHPGGDTLVYLADTKGDENAQIYKISVEGGEPEALTESPGVQYAAALGNPFSPDGRFIAYTGNDREPADQDVLIRDLATRDVRRLYTGGGRANAGHWSPDGAWLSVVEWRNNSEHIVYVVPVDGGPARKLTPDGQTARYGLGPWLPDGSGFLVTTNMDHEFTGLAVLDASDGGLTWLDTPDWDVEEVALSSDGRMLVWTVNVDGTSQLRVRDLTNGTDLTVPALPMGVVSEVATTHDGRHVVMKLSTPARPWNIAVVNLDSYKLRWLTTSNPVAADTSTFVTPTLIRYPSRAGHLIPAYLYRPINASSPIGVVIAIHGGPVAQERPVYGDGFYQFLLSRGVAVFAPNVRGSQGYGKTYQELIYRNWGAGDLDDFADAARYLLSLDWVDPTRIGLFGGSYGGFAVLSCLARLPEFNWAAGVVYCGPSNLITLAKSSPPSWRTLVAMSIGDPEKDEASLLARSPVTYSDQIRAPLFILQGANDRRVPRHESDQIVQRLRSRGLEVRYDVYPDEGHGFLKRENQATARSDAGEFLLAHLNR